MEEVGRKKREESELEEGRLVKAGLENAARPIIAPA